MKFKDLILLIRSDLYRYSGNTGIRSFFYHLLFSPGFKYSFWMRKCAYLKAHPFFRHFAFPVAWLVLHHLEIKYGISISYRTSIGSGLYIGHFGGIVINSNSVIGKNCNLSQGVTLGKSNRGERQGYPVVGDNVYIGPGAKIIGNIRVGDQVAVGANCVATKAIPDKAVVAGVPGRIISMNGSDGYINRTGYLEKN